MKREGIRSLFDNLGVWRRHGERAPYKPLLLLYALARYKAGGQRLIPFAEVLDRLPPLFVAFGPSRKRYQPELPFWYLQTDDVWEVPGAHELAARKGKANEPSKRVLLEAGAAGGLKPELFEAVRSDELLTRAIASDLLNAHFPETMHEEILSAVGLQFAVTRAVRNALFRQQVLLAYEFKCAVCGFDARVADSLVGIEAAHVMWHQAGGPALVDNGIAMCSLHHSLFDRGAFTLTGDHRIEVSQQVNGGPVTSAQIIGFHANVLKLPSRPAESPHAKFVRWHREQVFKAPGRWMKIPAA